MAFKKVINNITKYAYALLGFGIITYASLVMYQFSDNIVMHSVLMMCGIFLAVNNIVEEMTGKELSIKISFVRKEKS
ncbi:hypothetical protein N9R79_09905 [Vibrio sp.]|nr:hypothetical protein [Vibrio sp.]